MKKKVRYAAGAFGALGVMPALGLAAPAATAATQAPAAVHAPVATGKTVKLVAAQPENAGAPACNARVASTKKNGLTGDIAFSRDNGCINRVVGFLPGDEVSLTMRVRFYAFGTQIGPTHYNRNVTYKSFLGSTVWSYNPVHSSGISKVCEAIVSSPHHYVTAGPTCQQTGYSG